MTVKVCESNSLKSQLIEIGGLNIVTTEGAEISKSQIVRHDDEKIWLLVRSSDTCRQECQYQKYYVNRSSHRCNYELSLKLFNSALNETEIRVVCE